MLANNITDEKRKTAVFLSLVGGKTYKPAELKFSEIIDLLKAHFNPKPLVIAERFKFHHRSQEKPENVADYLAALRKCEEYCTFEDFLQQALPDSSAIQKSLLAESDLILKRALKIAQFMEAAAKQATIFKFEQAYCQWRLRCSTCYNSRHGTELWKQAKFHKR